ncbi:zinc ribbon domain-containing protein [Pseudomonas cichorii]|uniref:zinc ribbon domain-containing protein n=1 Tax=Pseudomonas cichorii TaxID=36746 RepID=UPI001C898C84|nr:zinc ribbon domain-containing protein [Pseudomonas cichorii]MBX8488190.1 zinc ribbon domain-containing protein [Pseudomonas cichorii]MBX8498158.1 zinc ribbon domain-containing protein [Pseudomonas cichorii]MBX8515337.1 zinc ribbon domain-containing protein [Pseudomonas cichorii]MBX8533037.1 zinc ribbon domain-containing protein [Pseudomonas cichorii]MBX8577910.1 zinc ribbon domain-containing protein [Pseudomonas cichorii]
MSLIDCPECSAKISDKAYACPHCGHPGQATDNKRYFSEKNIGQIAGVTGVWLTAPWLARMVFGVVAVIAVAAVIILR